MKYILCIYFITQKIKEKVIYFMRILICDDATFMRYHIKNMLVKNGHEVAGEAVDGVEAVRKYKELKPDIVTMDITMPNMSGIDALKQIMQTDPDAKVIMLTAMGQEGLVKEAIISGAKNFIVKPFTESNLLKVISQI